MKVKDIMSPQVATVKPDTTVVEAAQLMQKHDVGAVPVCEGPKVVGIVTDRDIVVRNVAHGKNPQTTPVRDVMSSTVNVISPEMSLNQAAELMSDQQIRRLPVVDSDRLVGMVSLGDLAAKAKTDIEVAETLGDISHPSEPEKMS